MKVRCPICKSWVEWEGNPLRPFCSEKCKTRDLGKWATEDFRVAQEEPDDGSKE